MKTNTKRKIEEEKLTGFFNFVSENPTSFHMGKTYRKMLSQSGFVELNEADAWKPLTDRYFIVRDGAIIAMKINRKTVTQKGIKILGAHSDSPALRLKPNPVKFESGYISLLIERYGSPVNSTWIDRPLSIAGKICWQDKDGKINCDLIDVKTPVALIPGLAIHLKKPGDEKTAINTQTELNPILSVSETADVFDFNSWILGYITDSTLRKNARTLLSHDLFMYNPEPPAKLGSDGSFYTCPRLDNQASGYCILECIRDKNVAENTVIVVNDHEEIGSGTSSGAKSPFLSTILRRIAGNEEDYFRMISRSYVISMDNAHATHPNYPDRHDTWHRTELNKGLVIKYSASKKYATESELTALFIKSCLAADIPFQKFVNRNDIPGGTTIGPLTASAIGCATLDLGIPTLAMHSILETGGSRDIYLAMRALTAMLSESD